MKLMMTTPVYRELQLILFAAELHNVDVKQYMACHQDLSREIKTKSRIWMTVVGVVVGCGCGFWLWWWVVVVVVVENVGGCLRFHIRNFKTKFDRPFSTLVYIDNYYDTISCYIVKGLFMAYLSWALLSITFNMC